MARDTRSGRFRSAVSGDSASSVRSARKGEFRKEGEYWTVGYAGNSFRLKDTKGLAYLAHLLRHPAVEFHVLDLAGGIAGHREEDEISQSAQALPRGTQDLENAGIHITRLGDAGEMLDEQAKVTYRRRLSELREEFEEAKELGKVERAEQAEAEIDALTTELSRAVGLAGRNRRAASASERARQTVTKSIRAVLVRIAENDTALGDIFSRCVRTGTLCSYQPDPELPIAWEFGAATIEPTALQPTSSGEPAAARTGLRPEPVAMLEVSPFSIAQRTAFVERETECRAVRAAIDRARGGRGSVVMLFDGPGVGKSRLAMEMSEYAAGIGFRCSVGHCYERDEPFPYLPIVEIIESNVSRAASPDDYRRQMGDIVADLAQIAPSLRRIFPDLPKSLELPAAQQRGYLFQSVSEAMARAAQNRPQLLVLEDLHWADESTLALLIYLANRIAQIPAVIVGTYRGGYSDDNPALARTLEELIRRGIRPRKLGGLTRNGVAQMLRELSQREPPETLVNLIFEESQGYPFFIEEVYRHLVEEGGLFDEAGQFRTDIEIAETDVPDSVRLIISRRLKRLDETELRVLATAAVIGRSFSFRVLTEITQTDVDQLFIVIERAQKMGIIISSSEGPDSPFTFSHELVRQSVLVGISPPRRQQLHARVAEALERLTPGGAAERASEIADHLRRAGSFADRQKLIRWLTLAGNSALDAAAFEEARTTFQTALSHQTAVRAKEKAELLARLAMAESGLGRWDEALAKLGETVEISIRLGDREMIGKSFSQLTDALILAGHFPRAVETARRGLSYLEGEVSVDRVRLLDGLSQALAWAEGYEPANEALKKQQSSHPG